MTTDIKLLPLPEYFRRDLSLMTWEGLDATTIDYARANVAHATAAKDAEIARLTEALEFQIALKKSLLPYQDEAVASRAEIEALRADIEAWKASHSMLTDTCHHFQAQAKRLAQVLLEAYGQVCELCDCYGHAYPEASFARYEALLHELEEGK